MNQKEYSQRRVPEDELLHISAYCTSHAPSYEIPHDSYSCTPKLYRLRDVIDSFAIRFHGRDAPIMLLRFIFCIFSQILKLPDSHHWPIRRISICTSASHLGSLVPRNPAVTSIHLASGKHYPSTFVAYPRGTWSQGRPKHLAYYHARFSLVDNMM